MNWRKVFQLALVHVGVSITVVPGTSTLNRIMIANMRLNATLVAVLVAIPYLLTADEPDCMLSNGPIQRQGV